MNVATMQVDKRKRPPLDLSDLSLGAIENLQSVVSAVGSPVRIRILHLLNNRRNVHVGEIQECLGTYQVLTSMHLKMLRYGGLVESEKVGRRRVYRLTDDGRLLFHTLRKIADRS